MVSTDSNINPPLAVLIACHNRRDKTMECLRNLSRAASFAKLEFALYLFDDGSTDGTADAVKQMLPSALILRGDGKHFWNRGMHAVFAAAMEKGHKSYMWLNDDTMLYEDALQVARETVRSELETSGSEPIVVGAICDARYGQLTYGGGRRPNPFLRPFFYRLIEPNGFSQEVDVMNGNVVLIPDSVARVVGNLDPTFEHSMGDTDYSLRARRAGKRIVISPAYIGTCNRNSVDGTFFDRRASLPTRLKFALSRKGLPWKSWLAICSRHGNVLWPIHFVWGYIRIILAARGA